MADDDLQAGVTEKFVVGGRKSSSDDGTSKSRSKRDLLMIGLIVLFIITTIIFFILFIVFVTKQNDSSSSNSAAQFTGDDICTTPTCMNAAATVKGKMNQSVDPCEDFFTYACGSQLETAKENTDPFTLLHYDNLRILRDILIDDPKTNDPGYLKKLRTLYKSCMNMEKIESIGLKPFKESDLVKTWPVLNRGVNDDGRTIEDLLTSYGQENDFYFFSLNVDPDVKQTDTIVIYLDTPSFTLGHTQYNRSKDARVLNAYEKYLGDLAIVLGADNHTARADAKEVIDLEVAINKVIVELDFKRNYDLIYHPTTLAELELKYRKIGLGNVLKKVFSMVNITLRRDEKIVVTSPKYYDALLDILTNTDIRIIHKALGFSYAERSVGLVTNAMSQIRLEFETVRYGALGEGSRWMFCSQKTAESMPRAMSKQFIAREVSATAKGNLNEMVDDLKASFKEMLTESTWMSDQTRQAAFEKIKGMVDKIVYPDKGFGDDDIDEFYKEYVIDEANYYQNIQMIEKKDMMYDLKKLRMPRDRQAWDFSQPAYMANAFYRPSANEIYLLAGMLEEPFYSSKFTSAMEYGAIGMIIGHEITHGFDDQGSQFDEVGSLKNWWQEEDKKHFLNEIQCVIQQYSNFHDEQAGMNVDGRLTQGENVADAGGLKEAFRAYQTHVKKHGEELKLPGLGLSNEQLFFVSFGQLWCNKYSKAGLITKLLTDPHSPGRYRVLGVLQNSEEFAKTYKCPAGSYMNPHKKCSVW